MTNLPIYDAWIWGAGISPGEISEATDQIDKVPYFLPLYKRPKHHQTSKDIAKFGIGIYLNDLHNLNMSFSFVIHLLTIFMAPFRFDWKVGTPETKSVFIIYLSKNMCGRFWGYTTYSSEPHWYVVVGYICHYFPIVSPQYHTSYPHYVHF